MSARYAELHAHSAYTFLEGTNQPADLVAAARQMGLTALGILDIDGFYSAVQTANAARSAGLACVYGTELSLDPSEFGLSEQISVRLPVLARNQTGYSELCQALSDHNLAYEGQRSVPWKVEELQRFSQGNWVIMSGGQHGLLRTILDNNSPSDAIAKGEFALGELCEYFGSKSVVVETTLRPYEQADLGEVFYSFSQKFHLPLVASGGVRCATQRDQYLADVMTASRLNCSLEEVRPFLPEFGTFLRGAEEMLAIHSRHPQAVENAAQLAEECTFDLRLIEPHLPKCQVPSGYDDNSWLRHLTYIGAKGRYGTREENPEAWKVIDHELKIIIDLDFAGYFLIVKDIVDFCRQENILCQGRGSAANSAVCYSLGITPVDAVKHRLLFERFLSPSRKVAPDIDIDIEAKRREEVIQYVYQRYGRRNAAQVANTITYRPKSAIRAAGGALGYGEETLSLWSREMSRGGKTGTKIPPQVSSIAASLQKLPRHMGIHPGGIVLTEEPVSSLCPVQWAAKEKRTVLQWDKEDCQDVGLVKFDLLGLGMLTALRKCFDWLTEEGVQGRDGAALGLYNLPEEDQAVYDLLCAAETVGVFQVESRAQMSTLPRLQPRCFYDLVVEVALIRPGPIQGRAVNPYLDRRNGHLPIQCHPLLQPALERTLGVPLFQEQLMKIAVDAANFTPAEADELRRAIGSKRHVERMEKLRPKLFAGMTANDIDQSTQDEIVDSLAGFAEFGFPESHAFSFAYLVYASAWLKVHYPEHFYAALLASQPMGFYNPASLIADAKKHGIEVAGPSVVSSLAGAHVSGSQEGSPVPGLLRRHRERTVRLGLESIKGLGQPAQERIVAARKESNFSGLEDFALRTKVTVKEIELIAHAGGFDELGISRRNALWFAQQVANPHEWQPCLPGIEGSSTTPYLPQMDTVELLKADYESMSLTPGIHPVALLRESLDRESVTRAADVAELEAGTLVNVAGIVTHRQRPGTARGVTFLSLEDETGLVNVVCTVGAWKRYRQVALGSKALRIRGRLEKKDGAYSLRAQKIEPLAIMASAKSRDFH